MAVDLSAVLKNAKTQDVALSATAANSTEITLPTWARGVTITFLQTDKVTVDSGSVSFTGTDDDPQNDDAFPIGSGGAYEMIISPGRSRNLNGLHIFVVASTNTAYARLDMDS